MKCLNCNGENILRNVGIADHSQGSYSALKLVTQNDPAAIIFKGNIEAPMKAHVCASCGYVMIFAQPRDVLRLKDGLPPSLP